MTEPEAAALKPLVTVHLSAFERVIDGGTSLTSWRYYDGESWLLVKDHPNAVFSQLDCSPGVLWETVAQLSVVLGTWLQRVDRFPTRQTGPTNPLDYLRRQVRTRRYDIKRSFFRVQRGGRLVRQKQDEAPI
jgi:hypothetical protein